MYVRATWKWAIAGISPILVEWYGLYIYVPVKQYFCTWLATTIHNFCHALKWCNTNYSKLYGM